MTSKYLPKMKKIWNPLNSGSEDVQSGCRDGIKHRKMCPVNNEKWKTTNNGRKRITKPRKNNKARGSD